MIRRLLTLVSLAPAVGSVVLGLTASQALAQNVQCGDVITQDVTLDSDVLGCAGTALTVTGGDVTLDLNGHVVDGNIVAPEQEQLQGHLLIREGTVHGFIAFGQTLWPIEAQATFAWMLPCVATADRTIDHMQHLVPDHSGDWL